MVSDQALTIQVGPRDGRGRHRVVAKFNGAVHRDRFDVDSQFHRREFREAVISKFGLPDQAHEFIEAELFRLASATDEGSSLFKPIVTMLNTISPSKVEWLWPNRIAIGKLNVLAGDPGLAKSMLSLDVAARVSRGEPFPDSHDTPQDAGGVCILTNEDDADDTLVPRLLAHNADLSRIAHIEGVTETDGDGRTIHGVDLTRDIESLRVATEQVPNCRLLIVRSDRTSAWA